MILIVELACATSMYAYKERLADGFDKGLNDSMIKYEADDVVIITDFDLMQGKVWPFYCIHQCVCVEITARFSFSWNVAVIMATKIGPIYQDRCQFRSHVACQIISIAMCKMRPKCIARAVTRKSLV